jgi:thiamine-phosphate pyrophosphorylase
MVGTRLCIVARPRRSDDTDARLAAALSGGDVASVLIDTDDITSLRSAAEIAMRHGAAAIGVGLRDGAGLDGVHIETGAEDVERARALVGAGKIVGAGGVGSRHDAMVLGERLPDYVFFGRLDGDREPAIHEKALELAAWWAELFEIPAIVMGGSDVASVAAARDAGIEFVALGSAVWDYPDGPAAAVAAANRILDRKDRK